MYEPQCDMKRLCKYTMDGKLKEKQGGSYIYSISRMIWVCYIPLLEGSVTANQYKVLLTDQLISNTVHIQALAKLQEFLFTGVSTDIANIFQIRHAAQRGG